MGLSVLIKLHGISGQFIDKVWWRQFSTATPCVFNVDFFRNYCNYLLYIYTDERKKTLLSENEIKFKNIQMMRECPRTFWLSLVWMITIISTVMLDDKRLHQTVVSFEMLQSWNVMLDGKRWDWCMSRLQFRSYAGDLQCTHGLAVHMQIFET